MEQWEESQQTRFKAILDRDTPTLLRESSTDFNFLDLKDKIENVREQVNLLVQTFDYWQQLPENRRSNLNNALDDIKTAYVSMEAFDTKDSNPWERRLSIVTDFNNRYNSFYEHVTAPFNAYLGRKAYSEELASKFGKEAKKEIAEIQRVRKEIETVQKDVLDAAASAGNVASTAQAVSFGNQANEHANDAHSWFKGIVGLSGASLVIVLLFVYEVIREIRDKNFVSNAETNIVKVAILAFLFLGLRFAIRNYSAHQHLYIVNKHRANILKSMEAFRTSALDDKAKDTILLAAVSAAYSQHETGFITTKEGAGSDDGDIIDIVKAASAKP